MPDLNRERADFVQMQRDLARFAVTTHDFVDRTGPAWFGNINYFEGGYFCCDSDAIERHTEPLHSRLNNERPLGCAESLLAWLMLVVVHPFIDGNGRFARCFSVRLPTAPEKRVLLGEFWMDYVHQVSPVLAAAHAAIEKGSIAELIQVAVSNARQHIESRKVSCARLCLLQRRMPSIASHICMGDVFSVQTLARAIGRSDRVTLAMMSSLVDVGVLSEVEAGSELTYRFRGLEHPIANPILTGAEPQARDS